MRTSLCNGDGELLQASTAVKRRRSTPRAHIDDNDHPRVTPKGALISMSMRVSRLTDAEAFAPPGHTGVGPVRLQGGQNTPTEQVMVSDGQEATLRPYGSVHFTAGAVRPVVNRGTTPARRGAGASDRGRFAHHHPDRGAALRSAGGTTIDEPHYFRIQGGAVLVEFDNVEDDADHVHSVWRSPSHDFADDLLMKHHVNTSHGGQR